MTAANPSHLAHLCAVAAGQRVIVRIENPDLVATWLRTSTDTVYRMQQDASEQRWTYPRLIDLAALELDTLATGTIDEAIQNRQDLSPTTPLSCDLDELGSDTLRQLSRRAADLADAITTDGGLSHAELRRELNHLPETIAALNRFRAAAEARLGRSS